MMARTVSIASFVGVVVKQATATHWSEEQLSDTEPNKDAYGKNTSGWYSPEICEQGRLFWLLSLHRIMWNSAKMQRRLGSLFARPR